MDHTENQEEILSLLRDQENSKENQIIDSFNKEKHYYGQILPNTKLKGKSSINLN